MPALLIRDAVGIRVVMSGRVCSGGWKLHCTIVRSELVHGI